MTVAEKRAGSYKKWFHVIKCKEQVKDTEAITLTT